MTELNIDFETASQVNLLETGAYIYAMDPSTEVLMMYWAFDDDEPEGWFPGDLWPIQITNHVLSGGRINAANATFERLIWWYVIPKYFNMMSCPPQPSIAQFYCTLYKSRCNNMPGSLDLLARATGTANQKAAQEGKRLIQYFSILDENGMSQADWDEQKPEYEDAVAEEFDSFCDYCAQDVRAEREAGRMLREPTQEEWEDYWVNERINDRGIKVDIELARGALHYAAEEEKELIGRIIDLTDGAVEKARGEKLKAWVMERLTDDQLRIMVRHRGGEKKYSLDRYSREQLLAEELDPIVAEVIECSDMAQKSSVGKFKSMLLRSDKQTRRVCGAFMANGAAASGRYSSRGLQKHNFPRECMPDFDAPEGIRADIVENIEPQDIRDWYKLPIMTILSRCLRPAIIAGKGNRLVVFDWSAIEGRVAPWLTCSRSGEKKLAQYFEYDELVASGADKAVCRAKEVYVQNAINTFGGEPGDITDDERQVGKVQELSLIYGGGANAFLGMARNYGVTMARAEAENIKTAWRASNHWATAMWERCETAAFAAIESPGTMYTVGKVVYFAVPDILGYPMTLFCQLPCDRVLTYPDIRVGQKKTPWGEMRPALSAMRAGWTPKQGAKEWPRGGLWGGLLLENITQGTAASILRWALRECEFEELPTVSHVHDEIILEVPERNAEEAAGLLHEIMLDGPAWAEGLPLAAEGDILTRYKK